MSGPELDPKVRMRRYLIRAAVLIVYVSLIALVFVTGKGHTILIDNKNAEDGSVPAIDGVLVSVDGREALELYKGDRDKEMVKGQVHSVAVEVISDGRKIQKKIRLPLDKDMLLLSVPMLVAGREPALIPFVPADVAPPSDESVNASNAFTSPGGLPQEMMVLPTQ